MDCQNLVACQVFDDVTGLFIDKLSNTAKPHFMMRLFLFKHLKLSKLALLSDE